jgi:molybdopterin-binding protein
MISARNQLKGRILSIKTGSVMCEVVADIGGGNEIVSLISASSAKRLKLKKGKEVLVVIKSTEVMISTDDE